MSDLAVAYSALQGMVIGLDGRVTYDFQGHVHAAGLDLNAGDGSTVEPLASVSWLRPSTAEPIEQITGDEFTLPFPGALPQRHLDIGVDGSPATSGFGTSVELVNTDSGSAFIQVDAGQSGDYTLLDQAQRSKWLQLAGAAANVQLDGPYSTGNFNIAAGGDAFPPRVAAPVGYTLLGSIVIDVQYSLHNQMTWKPTNGGGAGFITMHNFGAAQVANATYYNVVTR
jgi:hypothetical protein